MFFSTSCTSWSSIRTASKASCALLCKRLTWQTGSFICKTHRIHGAAIYGNIYHQYTPNVSIYTIHGSVMGNDVKWCELCIFFSEHALRLLERALPNSWKFWAVLDSWVAEFTNTSRRFNSICSEGSGESNMWHINTYNLCECEKGQNPQTRPAKVWCAQPQASPLRSPRPSEGTHWDHPGDCWLSICLCPRLVGGIPTPLKNMKVSWDDYLQYMEK